MMHVSIRIQSCLGCSKPVNHMRVQLELWTYLYWQTSLHSMAPSPRLRYGMYGSATRHQPGYQPTPTRGTWHVAHRARPSRGRGRSAWTCCAACRPCSARPPAGSPWPPRPGPGARPAGGSPPAAPHSPAPVWSVLLQHAGVWLTLVLAADISLDWRLLLAIERCASAGGQLLHSLVNNSSSYCLLIASLGADMSQLSPASFKLF